MICTACRRVDARPEPDSGTIDARGLPGPGVCAECSTRLIFTPRDWAAPRRSNDAAWARIADGTLAWDRRRLARSYARGKRRDTTGASPKSLTPRSYARLVREARSRRHAETGPDIGRTR